MTTAAAHPACRISARALNRIAAAATHFLGMHTGDGQECDSGGLGCVPWSCMKALLSSFDAFQQAEVLPQELLPRKQLRRGLGRAAFNLATTALRLAQRMDPQFSLANANEAALLSALGGLDDRQRAKGLFDHVFEEKREPSSIPCALKGNAILSAMKAVDWHRAKALSMEPLERLRRLGDIIVLDRDPSVMKVAAMRAAKEIWKKKKIESCISPFLALSFPLGLKTLLTVSILNSPDRGPVVSLVSKVSSTLPRVGYVSPDLARHHPVAHLLSSFFRSHS